MLTPMLHMTVFSLLFEACCVKCSVTLIDQVTFDLYTRSRLILGNAIYNGAFKC